MKSRWTWVPSLFAAEEIPSAVVIFVALLMFLQMGSSSAEATFLTSLLTLPWIFKPSVQSWVNKIGHFKQILHVIELLLFIGSAFQWTTNVLCSNSSRNDLWCTDYRSRCFRNIFPTNSTCVVNGVLYPSRHIPLFCTISHAYSEGFS